MFQSRSWHIPQLILGMVLLVALGACGAKPVPQEMEPGDSIVFGHIDMSDAPVKLDGLWIRQFSPPSKKPFYSAGIKKGTFFNWYMDPGAYAVSHFSGTSFGGTRFRFNIPRQLTSMRIEIKEPGIYYLGAYRFKNIKTGIFEPDQFDLEPVGHPTEKEALEKLLKLVKGTSVEGKLQQRLKELP